MNLSKYISELLYRYDCIIIPHFGGFVSNKIGARIDEKTQIFFPPTKQISFNSYLKHNDGLLANHIASSKNITFDEANILISKEISSWKDSLVDQSINLEGVGTLFLNEEKQICFEPIPEVNFEISAFGLGATQGTKVFRIEKKQEINKKPITNSKQEVKKLNPYYKYAAIASLVLGMTTYRFYSVQPNLIANQEQLERSINKATFLIDKPLTPVKIKVKKKKKITKKKDIYNKKEDTYFVIASAFRSIKNAKKEMKILSKKGFSPKIAGTNKWGLHLVSYQSFSDSNKAKSFLKKIKKEHPDAWVLVK